MSDFWIGFISGIGALVFVCFIVASQRSEFLTIKSQEFYLKLAEQRNKYRLKRINDKNKGK